MIPKLLTTAGGQTIKNSEEWETFRRKELLALFSNFVYGVRSVERPADLHFFIEEEKVLRNKIKRKTIRAEFGDYSFRFFVFVPRDSVGRVPVFIYMMHEFQEKTFIPDKPEEDQYIPFEKLTDRGYGIAVLCVSSQIYPDWENHANFQKGIFPTLEKYENRNAASWASISAWAWGLSRVADYLETDPNCDSGRMIACGHSRGGKTALWCAAQDERIAMAISNCSGCSGAAVTRGKAGEHVKDINITDWFCENYRLYHDREEFLPVDQHMLLALMAPRALYVSSASEDDWADPDSELLACRLAGEAYSLYGKRGLVMEEQKPLCNKAYHDGAIGYHIKEGKHCIDFSDWTYFIDFADKKL